MKKITILVIIISAITISAGTVIFGWKFLSGQDSWLCQNGEWVKYGNPAVVQPSEPCADSAEPSGGNNDLMGNLIMVNSPRPGESVSSPLVITGQARGYWFFEADFPVRLENEDGEIVASGIARAQDDWMTEEFVPFRAKLEFKPASSTSGILILSKDNPSGLAENAAELRLPLKLGAGEIITVQVFFSNSRLNHGNLDCNLVYPSQRNIVKTQAVARAALEELFKGTTAEEEKQGFTTSINPGVVIQGLTIEQGTARADFNQQLEFQVGGSCRVAAIRAQIVNTLKQFPSVERVIISINGRSEDILQP